MLIAPAPVAIPVSTANPPTESVASEAAQKTPVPETKAPVENPNSRHSTEQLDSVRHQHEAERIVQDKSDSDGSGKQKSNSDQQSEARGQEAKEKQQEQQQQVEVNQLKSRDREVRAHEAAHAAVGGQYAGAPSYEYTTGPDGVRYAVAGEVSIDTSKVAGNPEATYAKMQQIRRAALAPADPSGQDYKVAAIASQVANEALAEISLERAQQVTGGDKLATESSSSEEESGFQFSNPLNVRKASERLNQKLIRSGAFEDADKEPLLSRSA